VCYNRHQHILGLLLLLLLELLLLPLPQPCIEHPQLHSTISTSSDHGAARGGGGCQGGEAAAPDPSAPVTLPGQDCNNP
jgi:hypothetical protein